MGSRLRLSFVDWAKLCCWYLLHLVFWLISGCTIIKSRVTAHLFSCHKRPKKLPHHLALVIDSEDVRNHLSQVIKLLEHIAQLGLQHLSVYDVKGLLKSLLVNALEGHPEIKCYTHDDKIDSMYTNQLERKAYGSLKNEIVQLNVEILCLRDGKEAIIKGIRNLCLEASESGRFSDMKEEDIDISLQETGAEGPHPDLLLLYSNTKCLLGFPPWRLKQTEILHIAPINHTSEKSLFHALGEFSRKEQRHGK